MKLEFQNFELVEAINKSGSLSGAARLLGLSQPAISKALKSLEKKIGGILFEVNNGQFTPTSLAEIFLTRGMALKGPLAQIKADIEGMKQGRFSQLNIGTGFNPPLISLYTALAKIQNELPNLSINLVERDWRDIMVAISSEVIDFGIIDVSIAEQSQKFQFKKLPRHPCCIVVRRGHPLEEKKSITINDLLSYSYCGPNPSRWAIDQSGVAAKIFGQSDKNNIQLSRSFNAHTCFTALNFILNTNSFSVLPKIIFNEQKRNKIVSLFATKLVALDVDGLSWLRTNYGLVWNRNKIMSEFDLRLMKIIENIEFEIYDDQQE